MPPALMPPATQRAYRRRVLGNGLRALAVSDPGSALATVSVQYAVGWRSETPGRSGFAHLFEHLMFEGSPSLPRGRYAELLLAAGGGWTAYTRADFTSYWSQVPVDAVQLSMWVEADRMRGCTADADALANQISVVQEEIRVNVRNRPYGSFPFFDVPPALFATFANAHDGYGSFDELERTTLAEATAFHDAHYRPSAAYVTVHSPLTGDRALDLVEQHFGDIPSGPPAPRPQLDEPRPDAERRAVVHDAHAPLPALALGFRLPDPAADLPSYVACHALAHLLAGGADSRLHRRLVQSEGVAHAVSDWFGAVDQPFGTRHPSLDQIVVHHAVGAGEAVVAAFDDEVAAVAGGAVDEVELRLAVAARSRRHWQSLDSQVIRTLLATTSELVHGRAELLDEIPALLRAVTPNDIARVAAEWYRPDSRALVHLVPGAAA